MTTTQAPDPRFLPQRRREAARTHELREASWSARSVSYRFAREPSVRRRRSFATASQTRHCHRTIPTPLLRSSAAILYLVLTMRVSRGLTPDFGITVRWAGDLGQATGGGEVLQPVGPAVVEAGLDVLKFRHPIPTADANAAGFLTVTVTGP